MRGKDRYRSMVGLFGTNKERPRIRGFGVGVSGVAKLTKLLQFGGFPEAVRFLWARGKQLRSAK